MAYQIILEYNRAGCHPLYRANKQGQLVTVQTLQVPSTVFLGVVLAFGLFRASLDSSRTKHPKCDFWSTWRIIPVSK